ncbi:MAG: hypothetical protein CMQ24_11610 [Gammaproteobacteria bacterium]|nr:hypothetical protein [Gammaproteobacteria bacterium]
MSYVWTYEKLGRFTYNLLSNEQIKPFLLEHIMAEWRTDAVEHPEQIWTREWMAALPRMRFDLEILQVSDVQPRADLMAFETEEENFYEDLVERAIERETSLDRGVSTEPILVNRNGCELMDGYTRYLVFTRQGQDFTYAYVGTVE